MKYKPARYIVRGNTTMYGMPMRRAFKSKHAAMNHAVRLWKGEVYDILTNTTIFEQDKPLVENENAND
jgi:hypothetical protein